MDDTTKFKILVVDDEESIRKMLELGLKQEGYEVKAAANGSEALEIVKAWSPQVVVLDIMMPVMDGYDLCQGIQQISAAAMIMLTALDAATDVTRGLRMGAHDYLAKPFHFDELLARIEVQIRNRFPDLSGKRRFGPFLLDELGKTISYRDKALHLSPTEFKLLSYMLWNVNQTLSKDKILLHVWGYDFEGDENIVEVYVRYLREKLNDLKHEVIKTARGRGYTLQIAEDAPAGG
ncbi:MAG: response regulator transcription factor [Gracilibacteraceae bacterium]|jgi:two-component system OmpR family response regulator|nr:response regulator transcription factor [Gracilibacteraceae bacterium]